MSSIKRSFCRINVRPDCGAIAESMQTCSTNIVAVHDHSFANVSDDDVSAEAFAILSKRMARSTALHSPRTTQEYIALRFAGLEHEVFTCLFLDVHHRVLACEELFRGSLSGASVHPREVVKRALALNASALIFAHNHPSGVAEPSSADELITLRLKDALALVDIRVIDHLVVGGASVVETHDEHWQIRENRE